MYSYHKYQKTMALPPVPLSPRHALLPSDEGPAPPLDRLSDEDDADGANDTYRLANQHHVIGDSDDEIDNRDDDAETTRRDRHLQMEEHQELLASGNR